MRPKALSDRRNETINPDLEGPSYIAELKCLLLSEKRYDGQTYRISRMLGKLSNMVQRAGSLEEQVSKRINMMENIYQSTRFVHNGRLVRLLLIPSRL